MKEEKLQMLSQRYKKIKTEHYESYMPTNWTPQEKMDNLQKTCNLPRLNKEEIENLKRLITSSETESVCKTPRRQKSKTEQFHS